MPNLVGIWKPAFSREEIHARVTQQLNQVRVPGVLYSEYSEILPGFGMALMDPGLLENGPQPARDEKDRFALLLDGELYNAAELKQRLCGPARTRPLTPPELCLQLILQEGEGVIARFNGLFCLAIYDRERQRLTLISDRYGFRPLFYKAGPQEVLFGSELKAICAADGSTRAIDDVGTLELFCYGSHIAERTWIQGYTRLEPATILTADPSGIRISRYWNYHYEESAPKLDQETYSTVFGTLLDRAVERCMQGSKRIGIFLSGGYDSRSVAASIRDYHLPIPAFTFGHAESRDVRFAGMLAQRLRLDHTALTERGPYLYSNCRSIVWRTEGMLPFSQTTSISRHERLKAKMDIILTGFLAEFSGSHTWPQLLLTRSREGAKRAIFNRIVGSQLAAARRVFNTGFFERSFEGLKARFDESFRRIQDDHPMNMADSWRFIYQQPRSTNQAPSVDRPFFEVRAPHMDTELVDFLLTIPPYSRLEQRVYKRMIAHHFPEIRDVPCTNSGRPINPHFLREYTSMVLRYAGRKTASAFERLSHSPAKLGREFRDLNDDFRAEPQLMNSILLPLLRGGFFPQSIFNLQAIEELIHEHYQLNGTHEHMLSLLISWGLAAKFFLHDDVSEVSASMYNPQAQSAVA